MRVQTYSDPEALAAGAADWLAAEIAAAVAARGRCSLALSGGSTPRATLEQLASREVDWSAVHIVQVDERQAPDGSDARNWTRIERALLERVPLPRAQCHAMPVLDMEEDGERAVRRYIEVLQRAAGAPPQVDIVQLGLGDDGHTASLVPGDLVLDVADRDVAWTAQPYRGHRRMTLTFPCLARARRILWLVSGASKAAMVRRLRAGDRAIPAGRVAADRALLACDAAAGGVQQEAG